MSTTTCNPATLTLRLPLLHLALPGAQRTPLSFSMEGRTAKPCIQDRVVRQAFQPSVGKARLRILPRQTGPAWFWPQTHLYQSATLARPSRPLRLRTCFHCRLLVSTRLSKLVTSLRRHPNCYSLLSGFQRKRSRLLGRSSISWKQLVCRTCHSSTRATVTTLETKCRPKPSHPRPRVSSMPLARPSPLRLIAGPSIPHPVVEAHSVVHTASPISMNQPRWLPHTHCLRWWAASVVPAAMLE